MSSEIVYSGLGDQRLAEVLSAEYLLLLASREVLPNHPALLYAGDAAGRGTAALKIPEIGLQGYDILSTVSDGSGVSNTALTDASVVVTVARYSKSYEASDLARLSDPSTGFINPASFAADALASANGTLTSLVANVTDDFTATVGSTGVDITIANFLAAIQTLEVAKVPGPYLCILHPQQIGDLRTALGASAAASAFLPASTAQMQTLGTGYRGDFFGVQTFSTGFVPSANSGADRAGGMFGRGGVVWADASINADNDPNQMVIGGKVLFERSRTAKSGLTAWVTHAYMGVSIGINACGVSVITDL